MAIRSDNATEIFCGPQLRTIIEIPTYESSAFYSLVDSICDADLEILFWQTILLQANGLHIEEQVRLLYILNVFQFI